MGKYTLRGISNALAIFIVDVVVFVFKCTWEVYKRIYNVYIALILQCRLYDHDVVAGLLIRIVTAINGCYLFMLRSSLKYFSPDKHEMNRLFKYCLILECTLYDHDVFAGLIRF